MLAALVVLGFVGFVGSVGLSVARARRKGPLRSRPLTPIGSAPEGAPIRVRGKVACPEPLKAPYTGRPCVYFRFELLYRGDGQIVVREHAAGCDFTITDETGTAQVLVERAAVEVVADFVEMERASALSAAGQALLAELGWGLPPIASVELCEAVIPIDADIDVAGSATREPWPVPAAGERGYRDAQPTLLVFSSETTLLGEKRERRWIGTRPG